MISEEMQHPNAVSSVNGEETQPTDWDGEDPDRIRREVFKRMFPDVPEKPSE
jgi:hypothetical protein